MSDEIDLDNTNINEDIELYKKFIDSVLAESVGERELCSFQHDLAQKYNIEAGGNAEDTNFLSYMEFYDALIELRNKNDR